MSCGAVWNCGSKPEAGRMSLYGCESIIVRAYTAQRTGESAHLKRRVRAASTGRKAVRARGPRPAGAPPLPRQRTIVILATCYMCDCGYAGVLGQPCSSLPRSLPLAFLLCASLLRLLRLESWVSHAARFISLPLAFLLRFPPAPRLARERVARPEGSAQLLCEGRKCREIWPRAQAEHLPSEGGLLLGKVGGEVPVARTAHGWQ